MSAAYRAVNWTRHKVAYDLVLASACLLFVGVFILISVLTHRPPGEFSPPVLILRALGTLAIALLHVTLAIGPMARLWPRTTFLLANRRHLGVTVLLVAGLHAVVAYGFYGGFGVANPVLAVLVRPDGGVGYEFLGFLALLILFVMAATSHDFWLAFLGHAFWKAMHMAVYAAYALVVAHVAFGVMRSEPSPIYPAMLLAGALVLGGLHLAAGAREWKRDASAPTTADDNWVDVGEAGDIPDKRARVVSLAGGQRVAIFRDGDTLTALSNVCAHQGGPLGEGEIIDGCATCPWHGYQYEPATGKSPPPYTEAVPTYELRVRGGRVEVNPQATSAPTTPVTIPASAARAPEREPIYVLYRPLPATLVSLVLAVVGGIGGLVLGGAAAAALGQRGPGPAVWDTANAATLAGTIVADPYPMLLPQDGSAGVLLVGVGKVGPPAMVAGLVGQRAEVVGYTLERGGMRMLEVQEARPLGAGAQWRVAPIDHGEHAIAAEILDAKCYMGAMKPGDGVGHRACAILCVAGGIPPMIAWTDDRGERRHALLTAADGTPMPERYRDLIAQRVTVRGRLTAHEGWLWLAITDITP